MATTTFCPGQNGNTYPVSQAIPATDIAVPPQNLGAALDLAVISLRDDTAQIGSINLAAATDQDLKAQPEINLTGYPSPGNDAPVNYHPDTMWGANGQVLIFDHEELFYRVSTNERQSGSPILFPPPPAATAAIGVHASADTVNGQNYNCAVRLTANIIAWIQAV